MSSLIEDPEKTLLSSAMNSNSDLMVTVQLFSNSKPLTSPVSTLYKSFKNVRRWNEWVTLPIKFCQLPLDSQLAITIWDFAGQKRRIPYGGTTVKLFDFKDYTLKRGRQKLKVWLGKEADGLVNSQTDSQAYPQYEMDRLERLIKKHESGDLPQVDWLDNLVFRQIEKMNKDEANQTDQNLLYIDLIQFEMPVVFADIGYASRAITPATVSSDFILDPEINKENPIETKYRKQVVRNHKFTQLDKELKPNAKIRDEIRTIIEFSPVQELTDDEKNLLWKFRYYLTRHKQALTKFLKSITWTDPVEVKQAVEMLPRWAEIDIDDAIELLGPQFSDPNVRLYAVDRLRKASDTELELYLLQLVEAIKFEPANKRTTSVNRSYLARFLIGRAAKNVRLGNFFYWYIVVQCQEANSTSEIFQPVLSQFLAALRSQPDGEQHSQALKAQIKFMNKLLDLAVGIKTSKEARPKKVERLRHYLGDAKNGFVSFDPIPLPLDPNVMINGVFPDDSNVFKSSLFPLKITFKTVDGGTYPIIFKAGDDLRQDQLVIQIISLMDQLLQNENLDLKLTPYKILATGIKDGALQFIQNQTLGHVLSEYPEGIQDYLKAHSPDPSSPLGIKAETMDTFIRSCAGYCVITYLLGVGDRHLDNLLICPDGHFFHADFGYILGRDPKPYPPMMKLPIQIIDGMGGATSENYDKFRSYCFTAYNTLRKSANLILNLFALMTESSIPDIQVDRERAVLKVKEKFCLEMTEEGAMVHFQNLINSSVSAFFPMVIDRLHTMAQYWRA